MAIEDLVKELGRQMNLPLALDRQRGCRLVFDERWTVDIEAAEDREDRVYLTAPIGPVPAGTGAALLREMLSANLYGRGTAGAALALDPVRNAVVVQRILPADRLDFATFQRAIEDLIDAARTWRERFSAGDGTTTSAAGADPAAFEASAIRV
mgnify:CR=1 FL=1